ncbi:uncharacterized protein LOC120189379 [Hibiscus syriacus]|uniref:uncharacterized protein LOC120189379 n=1 Tax=Hibiscus syriacus TaxID=106335 RepID=UPI001920C42B|nr:uncharacterized protein LOC120189379 [Hibiscus syriacus]
MYQNEIKALLYKRLELCFYFPISNQLRRSFFLGRLTKNLPSLCLEAHRRVLTIGIESSSNALFKVFKPKSSPISVFLFAFGNPVTVPIKTVPFRCFSCCEIRFPTLNRSAFFGSHVTIIRWSESCEFVKPTSRTSARACLNDFSDEEFSKKHQEFSLGFHLSDDDGETNRGFNTDSSDSGRSDSGREYLKLHWRDGLWEDHKHPKFDSKQSSSKKTTSIGGNNGGGGGKERPAAGGTDGDEWFDKTESTTAWQEEKMGGLLSDEMLHHETRRDLLYHIGLSQEPNNPLLLANYAQFLYLIVHDYDRAEELFEKAIEVEAGDADVYSKYANFLWKVKDDMWASEEMFLEATEADLDNPYYSTNYADFLWNTSGEDTCYPLRSSHTDLLKVKNEFSIWPANISLKWLQIIEN